MRLPLPLLVACLLGSPTLGAQLAADLDRIAFERLDVADFRLHELDATTLERGWLALELDGRERLLELERTSVRSAAFELRVVGEDGRIQTLAPPVEQAWRGRIAGDPSSRVALALVEGGIKGMVVSGSGHASYLQPLAEVAPGAAPGLHLVYAHDDLVLDPLFCGSALLPVPPPGGSPTAGSGTCLKRAEVAWDCDYETFVANGSSVPATLADITAVTNALNVYYARDVLIEHVLSNVLVRTAEPDPYSSYDPGGLLDQFVTEWRNNQTGIQRDMAHLATGRELDGNIIGLAYVGVVCNTPWAFGWTQWNLGFGGHVSVAAHELGHNWGSGHCHDPCDIMCGGCPFFGPNTSAIILGTRNAVGCLDDAPPYSSPLPPHVFHESLEVDGGVRVDVLANDFDGNCDPLVIDSFDALSDQGGAITRSVGSGPGGRDELDYAPAPGFQGLDHFSYFVSDGTGNVVEGVVSLSLYDALPDLAAHYRFDELSGSILFDSSGRGLDGDYVGPPTLGRPGAAPGTGTSVRFDGAFDRAEVPSASPLSGLRKELSFSVWVNPDQVVGESQIFGSGGAWAVSIIDGDLNFRLHGQLDYRLPSAIPVGEWTHLAVVFDEDLDVTLYKDGQSLGHLNGNAISGWPGDKWVVAGSGGLQHLLDGHVDELSVYDHVLSDAEVRALYDFPGLVIERCSGAQNYCSSAANSVGPGALLQASGSTNLWRNDFLLLAYGCPSDQFGIFYYGPNAIELPFGNGYRCVGGAIHRYPVQLIDFLGIAERWIDFENPPDASGRIEAGSTWRFQFWYRDPAGGGAAFNLTDGVEATFCP